MALVKTDLLGTASGSAHGTGTFVTGSFTPPDNSLLVVAIEAMESGGTTDPSADISVSGGGLTFTSRAVLGLAPTWSLGTRIFTAPVTTGASMTLTLDLAARNADHYTVNVVAFTGYDTSSPIGATASGSDSAPASSGGAFSMSLSAAPAASSYVIAILAADHDSAGSTPGSGYTEIYDQLVGTVGGSQFQFRTGSTSTTVDWVDTNSGAGSIFKFAALALEIKAGTASPDPNGGPKLGPVPPAAFIGPTGTVPFSSTYDLFVLGTEIQFEDVNQAHDNGPKPGPSGIAFVGPTGLMPFKSTWEFFENSEEVVSGGDTNAPAGDVAVSATTFDSDVIVAPNADNSSATVVGNSPIANVQPNAGIAVVTATANNSSETVAVNAGSAVATVVANNPITNPAVPAGTVSVNVIANDTSEIVAVNAGNAVVTATADNPSIDEKINSDTVVVTAIGNQPIPKVSVNAETVTAVVAVDNPTAVGKDTPFANPTGGPGPRPFVPNSYIRSTWDYFTDRDIFTQTVAGITTATVVANNPIPSVSVPAGTVTAGTTVNQPTPSVKANAGTCVVSATANNSTVSTTPNAGTTSATVAANNPNKVVAVNAGHVAVSATANQPTALTGTLVNAGTTLATVVANNATITTAVFGLAGATAVLATVNSPISKIGPNADIALVTVDVLGVTNKVPATLESLVLIIRNDGGTVFIIRDGLATFIKNTNLEFVIRNKDSSIVIRNID